MSYDDVLEREKASVLNELRFADVAPGRPYHAALVHLHGRASSVQRHRHVDFFEFVVVLDGTGVHRTPGGDTRLQAGDLLLMRPDDTHDYVETRQLSYFNIAVPAAWWRAVARAAGVDTSPLEFPTSHVHARGSGEALAEARRALDAFEAGPDGRDLLRVWTALLHDLDPPQRPEHLDLPPWLVSAHAALREPQMLREGLPAVRQLALVSSGHLSRTVRQHFGVTPTEWVNTLRLERAATLLVTTSWTVGRIGADCGFGSDAYFSRCFSRLHGVGPREYRGQRQQAVAPRST